jgi:hypothetical protein
MTEPKPDDREKRPWWQTLPGVLTAIAGLVTAITGLVVALNQLGVGFGTEAAPTATASSVAEPPASSAGPDATDVLETTAGAPYTVTFPGGTRARVGDAVYDIVGARVGRGNPGELALTLSIRMTNDGRYDANFWDRSFRLLVEGRARAPVGGLNELVAARSTEEGPVEFVVPETARQLTLLVGEEEREAVRIPIALRPKSTG